MNEWNWFKGIPIEKPPLRQTINYDHIARNKALSIKYLTEDPELLFRVVGEEPVCMCGGTCGSCEYDDVTFMDLLIYNKTLTEKDFVLIGEKVKLNWSKICKVVPLSNKTLLQFEDDIDWKAVSSSFLIEKNAEFIRLFHKRIVWKDIKVSTIFEMSEEDVEDLVFVLDIIPVDIALSHSLITKRQLSRHWRRLLPFTDVLIKKYSAETIEEIKDEEGLLKEKIRLHAGCFVNNCIKHQYLPQKYLDIFRELRTAGVKWEQFLQYCKPDEAYISTHLIGVLDASGWNYLSKGNIKLSNDFVVRHVTKMNIENLIKWNSFDLTFLQCNNVRPEIICRYHKLSPEYIDLNAESLDWYSLCEYQELPEWLIKKHINKINWGQVSLYQALSKDFIKEYRDRLNIIKLQNNKKSFMNI